MADINVLYALSKNSTGLGGTTAYGRVRCAIKRPSFISSYTEVDNGYFAILDVFAFKFLGIDYGAMNGVSDSKKTYFSKGSIIIFLDDKSLIGKNVRVFGKNTSSGFSLKKQRTSSDDDGIAGLVWGRVGEGKYKVSTNSVVQFGVSDVKGTILEEYIVNLVSGSPFSYPTTVSSLMEYSGLKSYEEMNLTDVSVGFEYSTDAVDLSTMKLDLKHNLCVAPMYEHIEMLKNEIKDLSEKSKKFSSDLIKDIIRKVKKDKIDTEGICEQIVYSFIDNIVKMYNFNISGTKTKGKELVDSYLDSLADVSFRSLEDSSEEARESTRGLKAELENIRKMIALDPYSIDFKRCTSKVLKNASCQGVLIIGLVTGVGVDSIATNANSSYRFNKLDFLPWIWCLFKNPYICGLLGSGLNISDCDKIAYSFGVLDSEEDLVKYRNILVTMQAIHQSGGSDTLVTEEDVLSKMKDSCYSQSEVTSLQNYGSAFNKDSREYVNLLTDITKYELDDLGVPTTKRELKSLTDEIIDIGLIDEINGRLIKTRNFIKEFTIYEVLYKMGKDTTGISDEQIAKTITKFEEDRGFPLENLQKDGISLIKYHAAVLSGCAGSGKTTTSDCMVMGVEDYTSGFDLYFGAPTGKAARRLAEVVGGTVKTIHSMFGLGIDSEPLLVMNMRPIAKNDEGGKKAYFLDEMAMADTNLLYEIVIRLNPEDLVYLLGDIKQLPPIGKGVPFRALMNFLPCIELGVSKRAAANGKINYNVGLINFVSDDNLVELAEGDDFKIKSCVDADIPRMVVNSFKELLTEFPEDDIQVITGYASETYAWSTINLNPMLQRLLRDIDTEKLYCYKNEIFMLNDRVIHVKRNAYEIPRYKPLGNNTFEEVVTNGIVNGDLGKIVGLLRSDMITIIPYDVEKDYLDEEWKSIPKPMRDLIERRRDSSVEIRTDYDIKDPNTFFVVVKVYDVDLKEDVLVFYRAIYKESISNEYYTKTFVGGDLKYLDLAYALTCHKMQGSQSKATVIPIGSTGNAKFINRNMINTMVTRTSMKCVLVGSVLGRNSALTNGRRNTTKDQGVDILGIMTNH